jgi:hypothetical protein
MKTLFLAALLVLATANDFSLFNDFVIKYQKKYDSLEEFSRRFTIFKANLVRIAEQNARHIAAGGEAIFGVNDLADITHEEFVSTRLMKNLPYRAPDNTPFNGTITGPATIVDWRTKGVVTPVKNQGQCGSCWAFSATEALESYQAIKYGNLVEGSCEQVAACTYPAGYDPCNGGWPHTAYIGGVEDRKGLETNAMYPYSIPTIGTCKLTNGVATSPFTDDSGYSSPAKGQLQNILNSSGPPSVCVSAETWQTYTGGVMTNCGSGSVDHCVQAVGYNNGASPPYWIVRNSWGTGWGIQGYIYLDMTTNNGDICYIQDYMTTPTISVAP